VPRLALGVLGVLVLAVTACAEPTLAPDPGPATAASASGTASGPPVQPGGLPTAPSTVPPARLAIPAIGLTATVRPVGIDAATGEFAVPPSVDQVGWYRFGPGLETSTGSVVIAGHVDSAEQGKGAFFRLRELDPGDPLTVTGVDGVTRAFRVTQREEWAKSKIPLERYFARDGAVRLTLITCGGPFDQATRNYRDNIVITATPEA
jgi:hypothetical protein